MYNDYNNLTLNTANVLEFFSEYRKMDVRYWKHRNGPEQMNEDDYSYLRSKRHIYRTIMDMLGMVDAYYKWMEDMGME